MPPEPFCFMSSVEGVLRTASAGFGYLVILVMVGLALRKLMRKRSVG